MRLAKTAGFRDLMHQAGEDPRILWWMARWGQMAAGTASEPQSVPSLQQGNQMVESTPNKVALLHKQFFPRPVNNTVDKSQDYPRDNSDEPAWGMSVGVDTVSSIILLLPSGKAPEPSGITNSFLKMLG